MFFSKPKYEKIIVGLGNFGDKYEATRHNVGFRCIDLIANNKEVVWRNKFESQIADISLNGKKILLVKPMTYMNNSGRAVSGILKFYKMQPESVIVISDDVSIEAGRLRIRANGSHGGHNGLRDIIELIGSDNFARVKVGVGQKPHPDYDLADWVLGKPQGEDLEKLKETEGLAAKAVLSIVTDGVQKAMSKFNR
jgi:PTH1 family peptidyl-tRNA hydrolase